MVRLILLMLGQCALLAFSQLTLKVALARMGSFEWSWRFFSSLLANYMLAICGLFFAGASVLWIYVLRHYPLSKAYPLASMSYVIAIIFAVMFLHEEVAWNRWVGVFLIMTGCVFVAR